MTHLNQANKKLVWDFWRQLESAEPGQIESIAQSVMQEDVQWHGFDPIGVLPAISSSLVFDPTGG